MGQRFFFNLAGFSEQHRGSSLLSCNIEVIDCNTTCPVVFITLIFPFHQEPATISHYLVCLNGGQFRLFTVLLPCQIQCFPDIRAQLQSMGG